MYHLGRLRDTPSDLGVYDGRSAGHARRVLIGRRAGSVHQEVVVGELAPAGRVDPHLHAFEEAFYVLDGELVLEVAGGRERLTADDYVFVDRGVAHALRNESRSRARWLEVSAPQPGASIEDTVFVDGEAPRTDADPPYWRRRFDVSALPEPSGGIGLAGFEGANIGGAVAEVIVGPQTGASQLNLMVVRYGPGGFISEHDHAFEEGFFFLEGEIEAVLDGETHTLAAGDYCWSAVGSPHALTNRADAPVRWLETQVPQPPSRYQARFFSDWARFTGRQ
ncbi:MAG TPA: cupin domain-containing protein [Gaiellaceae bacterium]|nr:cupin domain-containing protein [Gaiellaceae bacterium]